MILKIIIVLITITFLILCIKTDIDMDKKYKKQREIIEREHKIPKKMSFLYKTEDDMQNANNKRFKNCINEIIDYLEGENNGRNI